MSSASIGAESGLQMLSRLSGSSGSNIGDLQPALFPPGLLRPHEVIEMWGPESTAVSRLCTHLLGQCLLPTSAGGLGADAIFVDTEHQMRIHQLVASLEMSLRKEGLERSEISKSLKTVLSRLLILPCYNSTQLLSSIISLPQLIRSRQNKVALVLIDSPGAFYLPDLLAEPNSANSKPSKDQYLAEMLSPLLQSEINQLNIALVFTLLPSFKKSFVANNFPNRSFSVYIKAADGDREVNKNGAQEPGNACDNPFHEVTLHRGKDFVLQTGVLFSEVGETWRTLN